MTDLTFATKKSFDPETCIRKSHNARRQAAKDFITLHKKQEYENGEQKEDHLAHLLNLVGSQALRQQGLCSHCQRVCQQ